MKSMKVEELPIEDMEAQLGEAEKRFIFMRVVKLSGWERVEAAYHRDDMVSVYARVVAAAMYQVPEWYARRLKPGTHGWKGYWREHKDEQVVMAAYAKSIKESAK